jgi:hypothetical protein
MPDQTTPDQSEVTDSSAPTTRTRSGRVSKPPERYEPVEQVEDDYADEDYDSHESDVSSEISYDSDEDEDDGDDDADDEGNLDGFVVADKSESDSDDTEDDGEPAVPSKKRGVQKRPAPKPKRVAPAKR